MATPIIIIDLADADAYERDHYGFTYRGVFVHAVNGPVHNPGHPHRVRVGRTPEVLLCAESFVAARRGAEWTGTGTWESGQPFGPELRIGAEVRLRFPNGTLSDLYRVAPRDAADPVLMPI